MTEAPKLEYPCAYPIKVMGLHEQDFPSCIIGVIRKHDPQVEEESLKLRPSSNGKYVSVTIIITATGPEHIAAIFVDLKATGRVVMVL